jgi:hypothetical protein
MPRPYRPDYLPALALIRQCIAEHGEEAGPKIARAQFSKVDKGTWSRWCRQIRDEDNAMRAAPPSRPMSAPGPSVLVGELESNDFSFLDQLSYVRAACDALQDYAWPRDPVTGVRRLRNPLMLVQAVRLRNGMLDLWVKHQATIYNVDRMRELYNLIIEEVGKTSPDLQRIILVRLRELNNRRGLTMADDLGVAE